MSEFIYNFWISEIEREFVSRRGEKANFTVSEPTSVIGLPKIYGQRILAQGANIWEWARSQLAGRPNAWLALGDDFYHKKLIENSALKCGLLKSCYQESLLRIKNCKLMVKNFRWSFNGLIAEICKLHFFSIFCFIWKLHVLSATFNEVFAFKFSSFNIRYCRWKIKKKLKSAQHAPNE